jgi:hypothetical protein
MDKKTKLYVGIGLGVIVVYLIWKNRKAFSSDVSLQTPIGGVRASVGGGAILLSTNPAPTTEPTPMVMPSPMVSSSPTENTNDVMNGMSVQPSAIM